jgi:hypothetical protein
MKNNLSMANDFFMTSCENFQKRYLKKDFIDLLSVNKYLFV